MQAVYKQTPTLTGETLVKQTGGNSTRCASGLVLATVLSGVLVISGVYAADPATESATEVPVEPAASRGEEKAVPAVESSEPSENDTGASVTSDEKSSLVQALPDDPRTPVLIERVQARWDVKSKRDFNTLYTFETPNYRSKYTAEAFGHRHGAAVTWHGIEVVRILFDDQQQAVVDLVLDHTYIHPFDSTSVRSKTLLRELWAEIDGEWFHVTPLIETEPTSPDGASDETTNEQGPSEGEEDPTPAETPNGAS